jgi:hypothetical protein
MHVLWQSIVIIQPGPSSLTLPCLYSARNGGFVNHPDIILTEIRHELGSTDNNSSTLSANWSDVSQWNDGMRVRFDYL